jgi:ThiF family
MILFLRLVVVGTALAVVVLEGSGMTSHCEATAFVMYQQHQPAVPRRRRRTTTQRRQLPPVHPNPKNTVATDTTVTTTTCLYAATPAPFLSNDEIRRYSRHLVLSDVGVTGQLLLKDAAVLVVGAGGLGSPALLYLAAAGIGHIGIVDADTVDESNLQRQVIHSVSTIGQSKCESAARSIHNLNPHVHVRLYEKEFTAQTAERILGEGFAPDKPWQVVIDGSDNFPTKYLIKYVGFFHS